VVLAGLLRYGESEDGRQRLQALLERYDSRDLPSELPRALGSGTAAQGIMSAGRDILATLFGRRAGSLAEQIARFSGAGSGSSASLLGLAAPLVLGALGRIRSTQGVDVGGLVRLLAAQRDAISRAMPPGVASALGLGGVEDVAPEVTRGAWRPAAVPGDRGGDSWRWVLPVLVLAAVLPGLWYLFRGRPHEQQRQVAAPMPVTGDPTAGVRRGETALATVTLPDGSRLQIPQRSFLYELTRYLGSDTGDPGRFVLERVNFETGSTRLTADSTRTVDDLTVILRAYPSAAVRLEGHTDDIGDAEANERLSLARAEAVKDTLAGRGVDPSRITTTGQGAGRPLASNETEAGRAQNRRLELVVTKK
jgi:outer membrane protein OmpA-like peptidoglycan-associated protein